MRKIDDGIDRDIGYEFLARWLADGWRAWHGLAWKQKGKWKLCIKIKFNVI